MKLYEISNEYQQALATLSEMEGVDEQVINDTLSGIECEFREKGLAVASFFQNMEADIEAMNAAEQRIAKRRKAAESTVERLRSYLRDNMEATGISKIECPEFSISLGKASDAVEIDNESLLPLECFRVKKEPDKAAIKQMLKSGAHVPGARLVDGKPRLTIR